MIENTISWKNEIWKKAKKHLKYFKKIMQNGLFIFCSLVVSLSNILIYTWMNNATHFYKTRVFELRVNFCCFAKIMNFFFRGDLIFQSLKIYIKHIPTKKNHIRLITFALYLLFIGIFRILIHWSNSSLSEFYSNK